MIASSRRCANRRRALRKISKKHNLLAYTVTVKVRYSNFQLMTRQQTFGHALKSATEIATVAEELLGFTGSGPTPGAFGGSIGIKSCRRRTKPRVSLFRRRERAVKKIFR